MKRYSGLKTDGEVELKEWIRQLTDDLKAGRYDGELVYKKRLTKSAEGYTKSTPPPT